MMPYTLATRTVLKIKIGISILPNGGGARTLESALAADLGRRKTLYCRLHLYCLLACFCSVIFASIASERYNLQDPWIGLEHVCC